VGASGEAASLTRRAPKRDFLDSLQRAQVALAACGLLTMTLVTVADVTLRYLFNRPIRGSYDLVECALVVFVFHGISAVFLERQNIVIDVVDHVAGPRVRAALIRVSDVVQIGVLLGLAWAMASPAMQAYTYGDRKLELGLPVYVMWIFAYAGILGTIACAFGALLTRPILPKGGRAA
jgi:TRAP-type C4-dicarboxylate transport system permease small subunit